MSGAITLDTAKRYAALDLNILPPVEDGTKRPLAAWLDERGDPTWTPAQAERTTPRLREWYARPRAGIGAVMGAISGDLECVDFDERGILDAYIARADEWGLGDLVRRVLAGYSEDSPNGAHMFYRCPPERVDGETGELIPEIAGSTKLAQRPAPTDDNPHGRDTLIETKAEGGFIILAPTNGRVNKDGAYTVREGSVETIATVTPEERRDLLTLARSFDEMPEQEPKTAAGGSEATGDRPGDLFNARATWHDVLEPHGWERVGGKGDTGYWRRPGKHHGISATTNHTGRDTLMVFSTSTPFETEPTSYSKFSAYALLNHEGDLGATARELWRQGYGAARAAGGNDEWVGGTKAKDPASPPATDGDEEEPVAPAPYPLHALPPIARLLAEQGAEAIGAPADFIAVPMLALAGGAIGNATQLVVKSLKPPKPPCLPRMRPGIRRRPDVRLWRRAAKVTQRRRHHVPAV